MVAAAPSLSFSMFLTVVFQTVIFFTRPCYLIFHRTVYHHMIYHVLIPYIAVCYYWLGKDATAVGGLGACYCKVRAKGMPFV